MENQNQLKNEMIERESALQVQEALVAERENAAPKLEFVRAAMQESQKEIAKRAMEKADEIVAQKDFSPLDLEVEYNEMRRTMQRSFPNQEGLNDAA